MTLFSASRGTHLLFSCDWTRLLYVQSCCDRVASPLYNEPVIPSQPKPMSYISQIPSYLISRDPFTKVMLYSVDVNGRETLRNGEWGNLRSEMWSSQILYTGIHSYTRIERNKSRIKCLAQGYNIQPSQDSNLWPWLFNSLRSTIQMVKKRLYHHHLLSQSLHE